MIPEIREYHDSIATRLSQICDALDGLSADQLNWRPLPGGNSAWVLATHTLGNARAWVLGIACGQPVGRDRPAEFASSGSDAAALRGESERFLSAMAAALDGLTPADLERRLVPAKELWGENQPHEISVRYALLQVIEHASLHMGHLHVTRDLALAG
jgi:uncharacterized damage-inducible protein DinB